MISARLSSPNAIIKWNPRREGKEQWLSYAEQHGCWKSPREGKRVALLSIQHQREWRDYKYSVRRVMRVVERFHSEFKTDLDGDRLPSGKFATHVLVLGVSILAYNILWWIGQNGLLGRRSASSAEPYSSKRHKAGRRRIRTVMQELMVVAARVIKTAGSLKLAFGRGCRSLPAFEYVYRKLAYG